ncbi:MAG: transglycosylase domain-containing protein [Burkholderiaceae bacterium]
MKAGGSKLLAQLARLVGLVLLSGLALQIFFLARIGLMTVADPGSTTFQRSEAWRILLQERHPAWSHQWVDYAQISPNLKRAVIASEDAGFVEHSGVEWDALEKAWERNQKAQARVERINTQIERRLDKARPSKARERAPPHAVARIVGGSTITQQLAKNLFLDGERHLLRKAQEFVITFMLEAVLPKRRILEIYLNSVEWGSGIFGAEAAAQHYFRTPASRLSALQAAQLAVMLPAPKRFEKRPASGYVLGRAGTITARMGAVELP